MNLDGGVGGEAQTSRPLSFTVCNLFIHQLMDIWVISTFGYVNK